MFDPRGRNIVIVKHNYYSETSGTPEGELLAYLKGSADTILDIMHPFTDACDIPLNSTVACYDATGKRIYSKQAPLIKGHALLYYLKDVFFTIFWVIMSGKRYDLFAGSDNLNSLAGLVLRALGRVGKVAYYVIDFTPQRFEGRLMNTIYQSINRLCCYHADYIWNVSESMIDGRESIGIKKTLSAPQITVPLGCAFSDIERKKTDEVNASDIVYFGALREEHGPGLMLEALPKVLETVPDATLTYAGGGPLKETLEKRAVVLGVADRVTFTGFLKSGEDIYRVLTSKGLALATYKPDAGSYKLYSDPGKVKIYLACGLPILITDVPPIAKEITAREAGAIVKWEAQNLADTVVAIIQTPKRYGKMRVNAIGLGSEYDWNTIWKRTFDTM